MRSKSLRKPDRKAPERTQGRVLDAVYQVWLAGVGVASRAQREGQSLFNDCVEEGKRIERRVRSAADATVLGLLGGLQARVRDGFTQLPPYRVLEEIRELRKRIDTMDAKIDMLVSARRGIAQPRAKKKRQSAR